MRVNNRIGISVFVVFLLCVDAVLELILINFDKRIIGNIGLVLPHAYVIALVLVFGDCLRRSEAKFPNLVYGGKEVSQRSMKRIWMGILTLSFILGFYGKPFEMKSGDSVPTQTPWQADDGITLHVKDVTADGEIQEMIPMRYLTRNYHAFPFLSYEVQEFAFKSEIHRTEWKEFDGKKVYEKIDSRLPLIFFIALYLYYCGIRTWPKRQQSQ